MAHSAAPDGPGLLLRRPLSLAAPQNRDISHSFVLYRIRAAAAGNASGLTPKGSALGQVLFACVRWAKQHIPGYGDPEPGSSERRLCRVGGQLTPQARKTRGMRRWSIARRAANLGDLTMQDREQLLNLTAQSGGSALRYLALFKHGACWRDARP